MRKSLLRDEMVTHESGIHWKACISRQNNDRPESLLSCKKTLSLWTISESCPIFLAYNDFLKTSAVFFKKKDPICKHLLLSVLRRKISEAICQHVFAPWMKVHPSGEHSILIRKSEGRTEGLHP
jgi:hypothetical protein